MAQTPSLPQFTRLPLIQRLAVATELTPRGKTLWSRLRLLLTEGNLPLNSLGSPPPGGIAERN